MEFTALLILAFQIYLGFTVFILLLDNREPTETFAWIFIFVLMPVIGFIIYLMFGRNWRRAYDHKSRLPQFVAKNLVALFASLKESQEERISFVKKGLYSTENDLIKLLYNNSYSLLTTENKIKIFHNGADKFAMLKEDLRKAKKYIHMEYFIWRSNDALGKEIKDILIEKARENVEIRVLYDFSGCFFGLSKKYRRELRKENIKIYPFFNYLAPFKIHTFNYRNHRKVVVIDGEVGYTGGMNVGQEYIDGGKKYKSWRDTHIRLEGEVVNMLQAIFAIDWYNTTSDEKLFEEKYFPNISKIESLEKKIPMQVPTCGFDSQWPSILHSYFTLISMARENIYISSPYFVPEQSVLLALKTAAMRGVDVIVLITGVPDQLLPYWAAFSYFEELLKAGVKIFHYQKGFFHSKVFSSDRRICSIGTANLDIRSFKLNYEINAMIYSKEVTSEVDAQFKIDLENSKELTLSEFNKISLLSRLRNSLARLISPLL